MMHKSPEEVIQHFKRTLAEWRWMSQLSEYPDEVVLLLNIDARKLCELAYEHPEHSREFLTLADGFKLLAEEVQQRAKKRRQNLISGLMLSSAAA